MAAAIIDDYRWLTSPDSLAYLARATTHTGSLVALAESLRGELTPQRAHLVLETVELRRRADSKFFLPDRMFFTRRLLEQATGCDIAAYKASRFPEQITIADLCCGIGGDLLALAGRGPCSAVDRDPIAVLLAEVNCRVYGRRDVTFHAADVAGYDLGGSGAWHLDPDRRAAGRRATHLDACDPGPQIISRLLDKCPHGAIKLAPAADALPADWSEAEREWIGSRDECRQQVVWFGGLARDPTLRTATLIDRSGRAHQVTGEPGTEAAWTRNVGSFVFEPHAAVLAAQLSGALAQRHELARFSSSDGYFTGDQPAATELLTPFEVDSILPFDTKRIKAALRSRRIGRLEIKHRAISLDVARLRQQLKVGGEVAATLLIAGAKPRAVAVLARRLPEARG